MESERERMDPEEIPAVQETLFPDAKASHGRRNFTPLGRNLQMTGGCLSDDEVPQKLFSRCFFFFFLYIVIYHINI